MPAHNLVRLMRLPRRPMASSQRLATKLHWRYDVASPEGEAIL